MRSVAAPLIIRPQTVSLSLPPFRSALPFRLRVTGAAQPWAATSFAPGFADSFRDRAASLRERRYGRRG